MMCYEANLDPEALVAPFVFAVLTAHWEGQHIVRQVTELAFVTPGGELSRLARSSAEGLRLEADGMRTLAQWSGVPVEDVRAEIGERAAQLRV